MKYEIRFYASLAAIVMALSSAIIAAAPTQAATTTHSCTRVYYRGTAAHPTQLQAYCNGGATVIKVNAPFPRYLNVSAGGINVTAVIIVNGEARMFFKSPGINCVAVRNLAKETAAQTRRYGDCS